MALAKNKNKAGMTLLGDCVKNGGSLIGKPAVCKDGNGTRKDVWMRRGASKSGGNSGTHTQMKGSRNCTAKAAAHGTAHQGSKCLPEKRSAK